MCANRQLFYENEEREVLVNEIVSQLLDNTESVILCKWANKHAISYTVEKCINDISNSITLDLPSYFNEVKKNEQISQCDIASEPEIDNDVLRSISNEIVEELIEHAMDIYERLEITSLSPDSEFDNSDSSIPSEISIQQLFLETTEPTS
ncbi:hypothetical protein ACTXT7_008734 [Hymenolepis weldensis]